MGLLGGSFDPVHRAHTALAEAACGLLPLDELQLIPAADPWQRTDLQASPAHRLAMLELAIAGKPCLRVNPMEITRGGKTYTIDTLEQLPGDADYYWILGADQLANFCSWHRWRDIARKVRLVVAQRPGAHGLPAPALRRLLDEAGTPLIELPFEAMAISASDIRQRLAQGLPLGGQLDEAVHEYIRQHGLYRACAATPPGVS